MCPSYIRTRLQRWLLNTATGGCLNGWRKTAWVMPITVSLVCRSPLTDASCSCSRGRKGCSATMPKRVSSCGAPNGGSASPISTSTRLPSSAISTIKHFSFWTLIRERSSRRRLPPAIGALLICRKDTSSATPPPVSGRSSAPRIWKRWRRYPTSSSAKGSGASTASV